MIGSIARREARLAVERLRERRLHAHRTRGRGRPRDGRRRLDLRPRHLGDDQFEVYDRIRLCDAAGCHRLTDGVSAANAPPSQANLWDANAFAACASAVRGGHKVPGDSRVATQCVKGRAVDALYCAQGCTAVTGNAPDACVNGQAQRCSCDGVDSGNHPVIKSPCTGTYPLLG